MGPCGICVMAFLNSVIPAVIMKPTHARPIKLGLTALLGETLNLDPVLLAHSAVIHTGICRIITAYQNEIQIRARALILLSVALVLVSLLINLSFILTGLQVLGYGCCPCL